MKRKLILTFLACGASLMLGAAAQAESPALVSSTTSTTSTTGSSCPACSPGACPACSPGASAGHKHGGGLLEHLTNSLSLSGSQQAQIAAILEVAKPKMKAISDNAQAQRKALIESVSAQITPLLTPDQQTTFASEVKKFEAGPGGPRHFGRFGGPDADRGPGGQGDLLQRLTTQLSLTADQQSQIKPILDAAHAQVQATRQDSTLTQDQKFAKIKETMDAAHSQIKGLLTPAQVQQLEAMRGKFHHGHGPQGEPSASPSASGTTN